MTEPFGGLAAQMARELAENILGFIVFEIAAHDPIAFPKNRPWGASDSASELRFFPAADKPDPRVRRIG